MVPERADAVSIVMAALEESVYSSEISSPSGLNVVVGGVAKRRRIM